MRLADHLPWLKYAAAGSPLAATLAPEPTAQACDPDTATEA
jgi:hypothetical protein